MKNVIITGANSGLGFETAKKIANSGIEYRLILACRNVQKGEDAKKSSCIKVNAFNPGLMKTNFMPLTKASMAFVKMSMPERYVDLDKSSTAYAQLVTEDGLVKESGLYYDRSIHAKRSSVLSYNIENRKELWAKSCEYCGL